MSTQSLNGFPCTRKPVSFTTRAVLIACAALAITVPSMRADTAGQTKIEAEIQTIQPGKTILSCSASTLATAVADAIRTGTSTPTDFAVSALQPYPVATGTSVRSDRNTTAALVVSAAVNELVAKHDATFQGDVSTMVDSVCTVNGTNAGRNLASTGTTGMSLVVERSLATISSIYSTASLSGTPSSTTIIRTNLVIGQKLATDNFLENLPGLALINIAENAMLGVTGTAGLNVGVAPLAAENFAAGLVATGTNPDRAQGVSFPTFATDLLTKVAGNASIDELVSYSIGLHDNNTTTAVHQSALVSLGEALFAKYPAAEFKITQGLAGSVPQGSNSAGETTRVQFANALTTGTVADAVNILKGMIYVDPFYAAGTAAKTGFTFGVFSTVLAKSGSTALINISGSAATVIGNVLGQDGAVLTEVAGTFANFVAAGDLGLGSAGTYATDLISGAQTSTVPTSQFTGVAAGAGGGQLYLGTTSTSNNMKTAVVKDLASITDLLADGIIRRLGVTAIDSSPSTAATDIGALIAAVTKFTANETFTDTDTSTRSGSVGVFLAATLDDYIVSLGFDSSAQSTILNTITADAKIHVTNSTYQTELANQQTDAAEKRSPYVAITGALAGEETTCTNL